MSKSNILIITNKEDITVDFVVNELNKRQICFYRLNTEEIGNTIYVEINFTNERYLIYDGNSIFDINNFNSIYFRRPKSPIFNDLTLGESNYFLREHEALLEGIYQILRNKKWLNNVYNIRIAENKIYQQILANKIGFLTPVSIITNKIDRANNFIKGDDTIFKPLKNGFIEEFDQKSKILFTNVVDDKFKSNIESIKTLPTYFQKLIKKKSDIRVTVVGQKINTVEIDSQHIKDAEIDWRKSKEIPKHEKISLNDNLNKKILELCRILNLNFAAIDFVKDLEGNYVFLEINPNGQWGWIEKLLDIKISEQIVDFFL